jgi:hypothetical protein
VTTQSKRFKIALSFPGEYRDFVAQVAQHLAAEFGQDQVLYDKYYEAEFARPDLDVYLPNLYRSEAELIAVFLCAEYAQKRWCRLEWRHVRQMIATTDQHRIMFLSFDNIGAVPEIGILSGDGYVSIGQRAPQEIAELILQRLRLNVGLPGAAPLSPTAASDSASPDKASSPALKMWQKRLAFLQEEEAKTSDAGQKFSIQQGIEEAKAKIREFGGSA